MVDLNKLIGSIKRIHVANKSSERIMDAIIVDYTYNPQAPTYRQHRIDYVTTDGVIGNIFVNDKTSYVDIEVSEHVKKYLMLIKESILRKKEAYEIYEEEMSNIQFLIKDLLKEEDILSIEDFEKELTSKLKEKSISFSYIYKRNGKTLLGYELNSDIGLEIIIKKHFIRDIRIMSSKDTKKKVGDLDFVEMNRGVYLHIKDKNKYDEFTNSYKTLETTSDEFINLISYNNLKISYSDILTIDEETKNIYFNSLDIIKSNDKDDIMLLNNDAIDVILNILDFIKIN